VKTFTLIALLPAFWLASCSSHSKPQTTASKPTSARVRTVDEWSAEISKDNGIKQDANGNMVPTKNKRSSFESTSEFHGAHKDYKKQAYKTGDYAKKSWWGNKEYDRKSYAGKTDGSRFQKASSLQGKGAREASRAADIPDTYQTDDYATTTAREGSATKFKKTSNDLTESRRKSFKQPEIYDWREQRTMSVEQSRGILGH
jgi:hypothetical protein